MYLNFHFLQNDAYECPPYNGYGLVDGVGMQDNNELDLPYEFPKAFRNIPEKKGMYYGINVQSDTY